MTRKDYEIFRVVINNKCSEKYSLTDARRENNYGKNIPKLRLKQTEYSTLLKVNPLDKEITTDIFIIENVDELKIVKGIHGVLCLIMGYLLACRRIAEYKETFCEVYKEKDFKIKLFIPCARELTKSEVEKDYEINTGKVIIETIENRKINPMAIPGIVVKNHGPFTWGESPDNAVRNAVILERIAEMNLKTLLLNQNAEMKQYILDKHYMRKHGPNAYYGQKFD